MCITFHLPFCSTFQGHLLFSASTTGLQSPPSTHPMSFTLMNPFFFSYPSTHSSVWQFGYSNSPSPFQQPYSFGESDPHPSYPTTGHSASLIYSVISAMWLGYAGISSSMSSSCFQLRVSMQLLGGPICLATLLTNMPFLGCAGALPRNIPASEQMPSLLVCCRSAKC